MAEVIVFSLELALGIVVPWWILRRDLARLSATRLERAWNDASFWMSIVVFGPLCLPFHFTKTRRSLLGLLQGLAWMVAAFATIAIVASFVEWLFGV
jgi:hypothetical protein